jgi:glutathione S-transferase
MRAAMQPEPHGMENLIARESARVHRAADALEDAVAGRVYREPINAAQIVLGAALGVADVRLHDWPWRAGHPGLSIWYDTIAARPSFRSTVPPAS